MKNNPPTKKAMLLMIVLITYADYTLKSSLELQKCSNVYNKINIVCRSQKIKTNLS